ncbi:MAG: hypothetical protein IKS32_08440 [Solobacterium sp.]|nr:hypothetical protein [Solobacterium sp.]
MEHSEIKTEQLEEVAGGSDVELKPVKPGRCRRCGREEELSYLNTHEWLCEICVNHKPIDKCPYCGGTLTIVPGTYEVGKPTYTCESCGKTVQP